MTLELNQSLEFSLALRQDGSVDSRDKDGDGVFDANVNAPALTGGGADFQYSMTGDSEGDTLTLSTDGTYSFGTTAPELIWLIRPALSSDKTGGPMDTTTDIRVGTGVTELSGTGTSVKASSKMPEGYGMEVGSESDTDLNEASAIRRMRFEFDPHTRGFESRVMYMPDEHAQSIYQYCFKLNPDLTGTSGSTVDWQIKETWNAANKEFSGSDGDGEPAQKGTDFYFIANHNRGANLDSDFDVTPDLASNRGGISYDYGPGDVIRGSNVLSSRQIGDSNEFKVPLDEPYTVEFAWDQGDTTRTTSPWNGQTRVHVASLTNGEELYMSSSGHQLHEPDNTDKIIDSANLPGFSRGFNVPLNHHWLMGHHFKQKNWSRVAVCDTSDYFASSKKQHLIPVSWSDTSVDYEIVGGWWAPNELGGKWLCLVDDTDTQVASIQIGTA